MKTTIYAPELTEVRDQVCATVDQYVSTLFTGHGWQGVVNGQFITQPYPNEKEVRLLARQEARARLVRCLCVMTGGHG